MKRLLIFALALLLCASSAFADYISIYTDASGSSCLLSPGFSTNTTVIHKYSVGATGARFGISAPAGSTLFGFQCNYCPVPVAGFDDIVIGYGACRTGPIVLGTLVAILNYGNVSVVPPAGSNFVLYTDCNYVEGPATGGSAIVGGSYDPCILATEPTTWGGVKALYR